METTEIANPLWSIFLIIFFVILNGFFVAAEFALVKLRPSKIKELLTTGDRGAKNVYELTKDLDRTLTSIQLGITLASIALGLIGEPFFAALIVNGINWINGLFNLSITLNSVVLHTFASIFSYLFVAFLHVVIGEIMPKTIAIQYPESTAKFIALPLILFNRASGFFITFFIKTSNFLIRLIGIEPIPESHLEAFTEEELKIILKNSIFDKGIEEYEYRYIRNILEFNDTTVRTVLTPRIDVRALPITCTAKDLLELSVETGFSRIPIYNKNLDDTENFIHIKDVLPFLLGKKEFVVKDHLRDVITVYQEKSLYSLLDEMKSKNIQMALIYDEYGSLDGLVTIEDLLEEIFGDIQDEFDEDIIHDELLEKNGHYIVGGLISIGNFNKKVRSKYEVEIQSEESVTLAGYVIELFKSEIPEIGQKTEDENFKFEIIAASGMRIDTIKVIPKLNIQKSTNGNEINPEN